LDFELGIMRSDGDQNLQQKVGAPVENELKTQSDQSRCVAMTRTNRKVEQQI